MKSFLIIGMMLSLNAFAAEPTYEVTGDTACVLQILKEVPAPSMVVACGAKTYVNMPIQSYTAMGASAAVFQAAMKQDFVSKLGDLNTVVCLNYDNDSSLVLICKRK